MRTEAEVQTASELLRWCAFHQLPAIEMELLSTAEALDWVAGATNEFGLALAVFARNRAAADAANVEKAVAAINASSSPAPTS